VYWIKLAIRTFPPEDLDLCAGVTDFFPCVRRSSTADIYNQISRLQNWIQMEICGW
jgi:hypothetical protein